MLIQRRNNVVCPVNECAEISHLTAQLGQGVLGIGYTSNPTMPDRN